MKRSKNRPHQPRDRSPLAARNDTSNDDLCPCGSGTTYGQCCRPLHDGDRHAATCEQLMRARYSAHVVGDEAFLLRTWDPSERPTVIGFDPAIRWDRLEIVGATGGNLLDTEGTVEFIAHYHRDDGGAKVVEHHHERSQFVRNDTRWVYLDGT